MPRSSKALLPATIRTYPRPKPRGGRCSHGLCCLSRALPRAPWGRLPAPFPHALSAIGLGETDGPELQGVAERTSRQDLASLPALLRFSTRTCPRLLPKTRCPVGYPTGSETARRVGSRMSEDPRSPDLPKEAARNGPGGPNREPDTLSDSGGRPPRSSGLEESPPLGPLSHTMLSKRNFQAGRSSRCQSRAPSLAIDLSLASSRSQYDPESFDHLTA
jgi:hypothetical protein